MIVGMYLETCCCAKCRISGMGNDFCEGNILGVQTHSLTRSTYSAFIYIHVRGITAI